MGGGLFCLVKCGECCRLRANEQQPGYWLRGVLSRPVWFARSLHSRRRLADGDIVWVPGLSFLGLGLEQPT